MDDTQTDVTEELNNLMVPVTDETGDIFMEEPPEEELPEIPLMCLNDLAENRVLDKDKAKELLECIISMMLNMDAGCRSDLLHDILELNKYVWALSNGKKKKRPTESVIKLLNIVGPLIQASRGEQLLEQNLHEDTTLSITAIDGDGESSEWLLPIKNVRYVNDLFNLSD